MKKLLRFFLCMSFIVAPIYSYLIPPVVPGEPLYAIATEIVDGINLLGFDVSQIEFNLENLSGSNLEQVASLLDQVIISASQAEVISQSLVSGLTSISSLLDDLSGIASEIAQIQTDVNQIYNTSTNIDSKVDTLTIISNNTYNSTTQIDSKVDTVLEELGTLGSQVSVIDLNLQNLSGSSLEQTASLLEVIVDSASQADAISQSLVSGLTSISSLLDDLSGIASDIEQIQTGFDQVYSTVTDIDSKIDTVLGDLTVIESQIELGLMDLSSLESLVEQLREIPDFVQTPTTFVSYPIQSNTSRYFCQKFNPTIAVGNDVYVATLYNSGINNRVIRISAVTLSSTSNASVGELYLSFYKDSVLAGTTFNPVSNSDIRIDTTATVSSLGSLVFGISGASGTTPAYPTSSLNFIPKELYSVIIAPGEYLTITDTSNNNHTLLCMVMWEEIIS